MLRKEIALFIAVLFIFVDFVSALNVTFIKESKPLDRGNWLYVGGNGTGNYTTIQSAIDAADSGDTIFVFNGTYLENVIVNKTIDLFGEDKNITIIDGDFKAVVIDIQANNVTIKDFSIMNCSNEEFSVVQIKDCENIKVKENIISVGQSKGNSRSKGIFIQGSINCLIQDNIIFAIGYNSATGIEMRVTDSINNIVSNEIYGYSTGLDAISSNNTFLKNNIHHNGLGFFIFKGKDNEIINNTITDNEKGMSINFCEGTIVSGNIVSMNKPDGGIIFSGSNYNIIVDNHISENQFDGLDLLLSYGNEVLRNNFINNNFHASFDFNFREGIKNKWDTNYWSGSIFPGLFPKLILGTILGRLIKIPWFNIDWHPAKKTYNFP
jgi:nitrous oxidase accessory protein